METLTFQILVFLVLVTTNHGVAGDPRKCLSWWEHYPLCIFHTRSSHIKSKALKSKAVPNSQQVFPFSGERILRYLTNHLPQATTYTTGGNGSGSRGDRQGGLGASKRTNVTRNISC